MPILYDASTRTFSIHTARATYAFGISPDGGVNHLYWGEYLPRAADLPVWAELSRLASRPKETDCQRRSEFAAWGNVFYQEPCLKVTFADGVRDCELRYDSHEISADGNELTVTMKDRCYPLYAELRYRIYEGLDLIDRRAVIRNADGERAVTVEQAASGSVYLADRTDWMLTVMDSAWSREYQRKRAPLRTGKLVLESRTLDSNSNFYPYFALDRGDGREESGEVWFGTLQWCCNWKLCVESDSSRPLRVTAGLNDFDFSLSLAPGESMDTPVFTVGYSREGFGGAARNFHELQRLYIAPREFASKPLPVVYNAWAAMEFDITEEKLLALADKAHYIGAELFVVDDGWFGHRNDDHSSLGDWFPSPEKFPHGLRPLTDKCHALGMKFGLWVEPEMISVDSELYKAHPDWCFHFPTREREEMRHQLMLNMARPECRDYAIACLDRLIGDGVDYFKWDSNRFLSQAGWPDAPAEAQRGYAYRYAKAIYEIFRHVNEKFPHVIVENCAAGGMRADLSLAHYCSRINRSDNQDPRDELLLHDGFTLVNRSKSAGGACHVSKSPSGINGRYTPLRFRAHVAMLGSFAVGYDLFSIPQSELDEIRGYVAQHKRSRDTVQNGLMYRLASPWEHNYAVWSFVSQDRSEAYVFAYGLNLSFAEDLPYIRCKGLEPDALYEVNGERILSGRGLMQVGLAVTLRGDYDSKIFRLEKITEKSENEGSFSK